MRGYWKSLCDLEDEINKNIGVQFGESFKKKQGENKMSKNPFVENPVNAGIATSGSVNMASVAAENWWRIGITGRGETYRTVKIDKVTNGFIVEVGCKKFVAEDWKSLASKLAEYWKNPAAAEKKYAK